MRSIKRMIAVAMLAMFATMGAQTAMANNGILITDSHRDGILITDKQGGGNTTADDVINIIINSLTGVLLSD